MKSDSKELFSNRSSSREFLLSKTPAKPKAFEPNDSAAVEPDGLYHVFPEIPVGQALIDRAMDCLEASPMFAAMAVRIDDAEDDSPAPGFRIDLARTIDTFCESENGVWGQIDPRTLGCFFPEQDASSAEILAKSIRERLAQRRSETVSMGIAVYPLLDYQRHQIIENTRKALDHAAFFGPGSSVLFDAVSLNISGDGYYQAGEIERAVQEFETAVRLDPSNVNVHNSLGVCFGVLGDYDRARAEFQEAVRLDPEETMAVYNIGLLDLLAGNLEKALEQFLKARSLEKEVFEVEFQIGKLYIELEDPEKAKPMLEKAVELKPDSGLAHRYLGDCCMRMSLTDEAISAYKKAIRQNPNDAHSLSALGYLFDLQGENPEITTIFCQQSVDISPENGLFRYRLGNLYLKRNQLEDALKQFEKADELGHDSKALIQKIRKLLPEE